VTSVSIVISTLNRADVLSRALTSLQWVSTSEPFEVVVVAGPSTDTTAEVLQRWEGRVKRGDCPVANLSVSRNIGIGLASGDIVVFMDDDAVPEPEWLGELIPAFDPAVVAAGGFVFGHDGLTYQHRYGLFDRFGMPRASHDVSGHDFAFPQSWTFPHLIGTNSAFRREALVTISGFDEEYDYFLDDTDVVVRLLDRGGDIAQIAGAHVHHKFAPSAMRAENRVARDRRSILKNHTYFALRHAVTAKGRSVVDAEISTFVVQQRAEMHAAVEAQFLSPSDLDAFDGYADEQVARGRSAAGRLPVLGTLPTPGPFLAFAALVGETARRIVIDDPDSSDDVFVDAQARAHEGFVPYLIRPAEGLANRDFVDGVWVHSVCVRDDTWASALATERTALATRFPTLTEPPVGAAQSG
jgi:glycogen(starch) synthase